MFSRIACTVCGINVLEANRKYLTWDLYLHVKGKGALLDQRDGGGGPYRLTGARGFSSILDKERMESENYREGSQAKNNNLCTDETKLKCRHPFSP